MEIDKHMEPNALERRPSSMLVTTGFGPERERFEKEQHECISKAIKAEECAAKEKHIRRTIIGTWQERGSATFWNILGKMPLPSQNIMCWKAMMVFHKILREGHPNCIKDSYVFKRTLKDLYSVYKFATSLYGQLITHYLRVLQCKLEFHHRYSKIPGSLVFTDDNPFKMPHRDINDVFHFAVEVLDYQDLLLKLEEEVMKTIDKSRNSSQMHTVQCRIAPLVPVLKECSGVYDIIRFIMIKLHKSLPPDTLSGHRERFNQQFARMKTFIQDASSFAYITSLTSIPKLPDTPPNFLIYTMEQPKPKPKPVEEKPNTPILPQKDDRDFLIEQLMREINELQDHLEFLERDAVSLRDALKAQIMQLKEDLSQYKRIAQQTCEENVFLKTQLEGFTNETKEEDEAKEKANELFNKLKQKYTVLRNEHVAMIRQNAELKRTAEVAEQKKTEIQNSFGEYEDALKAKEEEIKQMKENLSQIENINANTHDSFDQLEKEKNTVIDGLNAELESIKGKLEEAETTKSILEKELEKSKSQLDSQLTVLQAQLEHMTSSKLTQEDARKSTEDALAKVKSDSETMRTELESQNSKLKEDLETQKAAKEAAEKEIANLQNQLELKVSELGKELENMRKEKSEQEQARQASESAMEALKSSSSGELAALAKSLQESAKEKSELLAKKEELTAEIAEIKTKAEQNKSELSQQIQNYQAQIESETNSKEAISKQLEQLRTENQAQIENLMNELSALTIVKNNEETAKKELENKLENERKEKERKLEEQEKAKLEDEITSKYTLIEKTVDQCQRILQETLEQFEDHLHTSGTTCTAEYLKTRLKPLPTLVDSTTSSYLNFRTEEKDVTAVLSNLTSMTHSLSESLLYGKATSHMASHEDSEDMIKKCRAAADSATMYLSVVKERYSDQSQVSKNSAALKYKISDIINAATLLIPKETDNMEGVGDMVDEQISATAQLVADASARIEEMLRKSRQQHTGVQLEVNERILDSCNGLMKAIRELILRSKDLQEEIVLEGKGTASAKEFYKRHHKWTEGLLSAAKSVGWGASILVDAADKVVERKGKFEELVVASNEIAASTAQLVAASRVKASKGSEKLAKLMRASKDVGQSTANVVATVKSGAEMTEDAKTVPDYSKLSLTQAKRLEMEAQVRMLELESDLEKERQKLGRLRKAHYQIAAELGLIEEDDES